MKLAVKITTVLFMLLMASCQSNNEGVFFKNLKDGDVVSSPVKVEMGVKGMEVEAAGKVVEGKGHHHIIINSKAISTGQVVPADAQHLHFGKGQTEASLELKPGTYTLTLQFANGFHQSYGSDFSKTISITVK